MTGPRHSSDEIRGWAWQYAGPSGRKFVLLAVCQWANPQGEVHNLTVAQLHELVRLDESRVRNHLRHLVAEGMLERVQERVPKDGRFAVCRYQVRAPWLVPQDVGPLNCQDCRAPLADGEVSLCKPCSMRRAIQPIA